METPSIKRTLSLRTLAGAVLLIGALYWGRELFIPLALAMLVTFLLAPAIDWLQARRVPNGLSVAIVTTFAGLVVVGALAMISIQVVDLATKLPEYRGNLVGKMEAFKAIKKSVQEVTTTVSDLTAPTTEPAATTAPATRPVTIATPVGPVPAIAPVTPLPVKEPLLVRQVDAGPDMIGLLSSTLTPVLAPLTTAGMVYVLVIFLLLERKLVEKRLRLLSRVLHLQIAAESIDDAAAKVGRYLFMQLIVNACYGVMVALAMYFVGLPNALLWGFIATLLRYIPYIGPVLAAALPILLSVAVFPDWQRPLIVIACFVVAETCTNMVLEPLLYGKGTGVSTIGVVIATFFWGWLWGGIGLVLAMPITVCLVVVGRHIGALATLAHMLSSEENATPAAAVSGEPEHTPAPQPEV